ncbi:MAG: aspartate--tRNA ligase, partial [Actinomycetia bacterium]|nr:aspartate--tRNA ligase [Actinomycetes bacterium]
MEELSHYSIASHACADLDKDNLEQDVVLAGWVQRRRDHGGLIFLDIRDRSGIVQAVVDPSTPEPFALAEKVRSEYVLLIKGKVEPRPPGTINPGLATGEVEVKANSIEILNTSKTPPFEIDDEQEIDENLCLRYRYLDLRRPSVLANFVTRHRITSAARGFLDSKAFLELDTPILTKSTPEGARDFLVPSRVQQGHFYALPQSPQLF